MGSAEVKSFDKPDETRPFEGKGHADVVSIGGRQVIKGYFEPGWRWSANVKPIAKTDLCMVSHMGYCVSGRMRITMKDGHEYEITAGDAAAIPPGHDAEVVGNDSVVFLDFGEIAEYAMPK